MKDNREIAAAIDLRVRQLGKISDRALVDLMVGYIVSWNCFYCWGSQYQGSMIRRAYYTPS
jgi:hypothetical protein